MAFKTSIAILLFSLVLLSCKSQKTAAAYTSETLKIIPVTKNSFVHVSYLETDSFGKVACHGLIYINEGEAVVFDTPVDDLTSEKLIHWISETKKHKITAVVINHFNDDCLDGLAPFHQQSILSYVNEKTIVLAKKSLRSETRKSTINLLARRIRETISLVIFPVSNYSLAGVW